jgi:protein TonB
MATIAEVRPIQLDPGRITAGAGAIALNALLLMLLLVPIAAPPMLDETTEPPYVPIVPIAPPPPPPPIEEVPVRNPITKEASPREVIPQTVPQPPMDTTDDPQPGDLVVPPAEPAVVQGDAGPVGPPDDGQPMEGAHLEYAAAPPPPYPREAIVGGLTGTVMLQVLVDVDGRPLEVSVKTSSGHRVLDVAARRQVLAKWRFRPAMRNGQPVQAIGVVPVEFKLD